MEEPVKSFELSRIVNCPYGGIVGIIVHVMSGNTSYG